MNPLEQLAELLKAKNAIDTIIAHQIGRPAQIGHVGEYIAASIFDIELMSSAVEKAIDGHFCSGPLIGKSVNIKWYGKQEAILSINPDSYPDFFLVMTGPVAPAISSRGGHRPWVIDHVYLFEAETLLSKLKERGVKIYEATSVPRAWWEEAEIYPKPYARFLNLTADQYQLLCLFGTIPA